MHVTAGPENASKNKEGGGGVVTQLRGQCLQVPHGSLR